MDSGFSQDINTYSSSTEIFNVENWKIMHGAGKGDFC